MGGCRKMYWKLRSLGKTHQEAYQEVNAHLSKVTGKVKALGKIGKVSRRLHL